MKKNLCFVLTLVLISTVLAAYWSSPAHSSPAEVPVDNSPMKYLSVADLKADIESDTPKYLILDVRKAGDYAD